MGTAIAHGRDNDSTSSPPTFGLAEKTTPNVRFLASFGRAQPSTRHGWHPIHPAIGPCTRPSAPLLVRGDAVRPGALHALADAADALARLAREAAQENDVHGDALVPIHEAARIAATSIRVVRDAVRNGELVAYGRARDRAIRRNDLDAWIASREVKPSRGVEDADIERRMRRLERTAATKACQTELGSTGDSGDGEAKTKTAQA